MNIHTDSFDGIIYKYNSPTAPAHLYGPTKFDSIIATGSATAQNNVFEIGPGHGRACATDTNTGGFWVNTGAFFGNAGSIWGVKNFPAPKQRLFYGIAIKPIFPLAGNPTGDAIIWQAQDSATTQVDLRITAALEFYFTRNGTQLGPKSAFALSYNQQYYIEVEIYIHSTQGVCKLRINGVDLWLNLSNQNTQATANAYATRECIGAYNLGGSANCPAFKFDDHYLNDDTGTRNNSWRGDVRIRADYPIAQGTLNEWSSVYDSFVALTVMAVGQQLLDSNGNVQIVTAIAGDAKTGAAAPAWNAATGGATVSSNVTFQNRGPVASCLAVSETPMTDGDSSRIQSATLNAQERWKFPPVPSGAIIHATALWFYQEKDDAGTRATRGVYKSGGVVGDSGVDLGAGNSYGYVRALFETDPQTGASWTAAALNDAGAEGGVKVSI